MAEWMGEVKSAVCKCEKVDRNTKVLGVGRARDRMEWWCATVVGVYVSMCVFVCV